MNRLWPAAIILILTFAAIGLAQSGDKSGNPAIRLAKQKEAEVSEAFQKLVEGIRESDVDKVMDAYHKDERTLFFNFNGTATIGWQNMYENRKSSYAKRSDVALEITGLRVEILSPTSAYVSCKWKQILQSGDELQQSTGRMTLVFKNFGKGWKIVHLHTSPDSVPPAVMVPTENGEQ